MNSNRFLWQASSPAFSPAAPFALRSLAAAVLLSSAAGASAEATSIAASATGVEELIVVAHPLGDDGIAQAATVLEGDALQRVLAANIGSTLATQAGVHNSSFGNAVGRPVIQGLGGPRVRVMQDRIDALDLSVTSADHVVTVEPLIAERVEILKGPSTLLYGTGAIGGVVDVQTNRIPKAAPEGGLGGVTGAVETRFDDNTDGNSTAGMVRG
ncbi:MAG: TonB-dependent receptor plug domain-containing protein, partial [Pseudomonadota bacterium]